MTVPLICKKGLCVCNFSAGGGEGKGKEKARDHSDGCARVLRGGFFQELKPDFDFWCYTFPMISKKFEAEYKKLNPKQREAVETIEGPVMVIAGPGTGKTAILTLRIANILQKTDTPASGILALTFTEAGAKEMKRRLRMIIGSRADEVRIHTYHGFAASIIAEFQDHFPHLSRTKQLTEIEAEVFVREILKDKKFAKLRPLGEPDFFISKILSAIKDSKKEAWSPEVIREFAKGEIVRVQTDESMISTRGATKGKLKADAVKRIEKCERTILFAEVYEKYEAKKRAEKRIDFDDLILELTKAFREDELLLRMIQEKFLYILVDEHQDTNDAQNALIRFIADFFETPNLFVVGDEKQAIYRFQGASVENFLKFQKAWKAMRTISLVENYRSHQSILDASFAMIENNYGEGEHKNLRIKLHAGGTEKPKPIEVVLAGNNEATEKYLVDELAKIIKEHPEQTVAIITRRNRDVERVISLLEARNIPAEAERGVDIFAHPVGGVFFELIDFLAHPEQIEIFAKTIAAGLWGLDFPRQVALIRTLRSGSVAGIEKEIPAFTKLRKEITRDGAISFLIQAAKLSGLEALASRDPLSSEVWRSVVALAQDIAVQDSIQSPTHLIEELLSYRKSAETKSIKISVGRPDSQIRVMTAHGSKGLEYDFVFLPYATEESWLSRGSGTFFILPREKADDDELRDARRLFYVALTRAKKHATIIAGLREGQDRSLTPLRFIAELDPAHISEKNLPATFENLATKTGGDIELKRKEEIVSYAKRLLSEKGLSVTALNHFMNCPSQFYYKSILKVPEAPSASSEKGRAMHEAFSNVWRLEEKNEKAIVSMMKDSVTAYFERSLLPLFEKEAVIEELFANAPKVAAALLSHFAISGKVTTEGWFESAYEGVFKGKPVPLTLHGQLDAVVETENKALVFDYKTREAMSVNAIKGETKDSDGNYFRQLVFYKILLEGGVRLKGKAIDPALVFVKPDSKGRCPIVGLPISVADEKRVLAEVQTLIESVWSGNFLSTSCGEKECECCALRKLLQ